MKIFLKIIRGLKISGTKNKGYELFLDFCRKCKHQEAARSHPEGEEHPNRFLPVNKRRHKKDPGENRIGSQGGAFDSKSRLLSQSGILGAESIVPTGEKFWTHFRETCVQFCHAIPFQPASERHNCGQMVDCKFIKMSLLHVNTSSAAARYL